MLCLVAGGSSQGIWGNALVQATGLAIIAYAVWKGSDRPLRTFRPLFLLVAALLGLLLIQIVPLPPMFWMALSGREAIAEGDMLLGFSGVWRAISLSPSDSLSVFPVLIPPMAMLTSVLVLDSRSGERIAFALVFTVMAALLLGALQVGAGDARFYLYSVSNFGVPTGFFANGNHMAALLLCLLPFAAALVEQNGTAEREGSRRWTSLSIAIGLTFVALAGLMLNRSLFGLAMMVPVGIASLLVALRHRIGRPGRLLVAGVALAMSVGAVALSAMTIGSGKAGEASVSVATRAEMAEGSWDLLTTYFPAGTGAGTFERVYPTIEDPARVTHVFVNHAHNDYLEWAVEGGLAGLLLLTAFLIWWGRQTLTMIRDRRSDGFAQAGAIVGIVLLVHSAVDFPLRTAALASLFALATGLILTSRRLPKERPELRPSRHLTID